MVILATWESEAEEVKIQDQPRKLGTYFKITGKRMVAGVCSSVMELLPSRQKVISSIPSISHSVGRDFNVLI